MPGKKKINSLGAVWRITQSKREVLVMNGKASWFTPYRQVDDAIERAGLNDDS